MIQPPFCIFIRICPAVRLFPTVPARNQRFHSGHQIFRTGCREVSVRGPVSDPGRKPRIQQRQSQRDGLIRRRRKGRRRNAICVPIPGGTHMTIGLIHNESSMLRIPASMSVTNNLLPATIIHSQSCFAFRPPCPWQTTSSRLQSYSLNHL